MKSLYLQFAFGAVVGRRVVYYPGIWIFTGRNLVVGDDVDFAHGVLVTTSGGVTIGSRTLIGYGTAILSSNHRVPALPARVFDSGHENEAVVIGEDVWIGANCTILPGVKIGRGCIIAAGAVVTKSLPEYAVAAGVPARVLKTRT